MKTNERSRCRWVMNKTAGAGECFEYTKTSLDSDLRVFVDGRITRTSDIFKKGFRLNVPLDLDCGVFSRYGTHIE